MSSVLTDARRAIITSILNWPETRDLFRHKTFFDTEHLQGKHFPQLPSGHADLPAISITPARVTPRWVTNNTQDHPYVLRVTYWTGNLHVDDAEAIWSKLIRAIYRAHPEPAYPRITYLKVATGISMPIGFGPQTTTLVDINKIPTVKVDFDLALKITIDPLNGEF